MILNWFKKKLRKYKEERAFKAKLKELKKRDPFRYKNF